MRRDSPSDEYPPLPHLQVTISRLARGNLKVSMTIAESGGIVPLVRLICSGDRSGDRHMSSGQTVLQATAALHASAHHGAISPQTVLQATAALAEVSLVPANRELIARAGAIPALVSLLASAVAGTPETAARALGHLARDGALKLPPSDDAAAAAVNVHTSYPDAGGRPRQPSREIGRELGREIGRELGRDLPADLPPPPTGESALAPDDGARDGALFDGAARRRLIRTCGGVRHLVQLLDPVSAIELQNEGREAKSSKHLWMGVKAVATMGSAVSSAVPSAVPSTVSSAVPSAMSSAVSSAMSSAVPSAVSSAVPSMSTEGSADPELVVGVQEAAAAALADLAYGDEEIQAAIIQAGGVVPLLAIVRGVSSALSIASGMSCAISAGAQEHAARAIWNLAASPDNQDVIVENGAIPELVTLVRDGSPRAQEVGAAVLSELAHGAVLLHQRLQLQQRAQLQHQTEEQLQRKVDAGGDGGVATAEEDDDVEPYASAHHGAMTPQDDDVEPFDNSRLTEIASAGGIAPLVALLGNGSVGGKEHAASALFYLAAHPANRLSMAKAGGIAPLVALLDEGTQVDDADCY